ncbi:MAG TPA: thiamine biosynthesis protein ThiG [Sulfurimonas sp. UBA12504]|nr:MAG: hypothetical protein A2019_00625 [Sulfurimonas sp. GWF2_37_8]DAB30358.1 MAG TPA: thiamine biosynthesis protein ThiG [Sulfurimonas sp. UBA12504]
MRKFKTYIAIDDTDEIGYFTSTGEICEEIREHVERCYSKTTPITRHQLLLHADIPYTSHNSSMCFTCHLSEREFEKIKLFIVDYVLSMSASSSAPGICMGFEKDIADKNAFIEYGLDAKKKVLTKDEAYKMAREQNLFLKELKNRGDGVIGALAGVALRLSGNDGRIKGKITLDKKSVSVKEILDLGFFDEVRLSNGTMADTNAMVLIKEYLKGVYLEHKSVLLVEENNGFYKPLIKENLLEF